MVFSLHFGRGKCFPISQNWEMQHCKSAKSIRSELWNLFYPARYSEGICFAVLEWTWLRLACYLRVLWRCSGFQGVSWCLQCSKLWPLEADAINVSLGSGCSWGPLRILRGFSFLAMYKIVLDGNRWIISFFFFRLTWELLTEELI